jgi:sterol desaturase/sphingolipid hydroxylase (fatty acid hydroxylase superfamily)
MGLLSLEQDEALVRADFAFYGSLVVVFAGVTLASAPAGDGWQALAWVLAGLSGWTLAEYGLHRFVLHGVQPFARWHALHHARPQALIATPTVLTAALFAGLVVAPAWWLLPAWSAAALVLGVAIGYFAYIAMHHAVHHTRDAHVWLRGPKRWHAVHHRVGSQACYGVSLPLWDHVFGSARPLVRQRTDTPPPPP